MSKKEALHSVHAPKAIGPYSQAIYVNDFLFVSGQIPLDNQGSHIGDTIEEQTHQVMKNLLHILHEASMDFSNVVKTSIFLKSMDDFQKVNEVYGSYFQEDPPARETVEVSRLPKDVNVEISCIAFKVQKDYVS